MLVTGGAGYVGGALVDALLIEGHSVRVVDSLVYEDSYLKEVDFHYADVTDEQAMRIHYEWADVVVFLAGVVGDPACALNPSHTHSVNVTAVEILLKLFQGRIVFPSTCSVYGAQHEVLTETSPTNPLSLYAETKLVAEEILTAAPNPVLIFRLGTLFGLSDRHARLRADLVLNIMTIRAVLEGAIEVFGGRQFRPLLHVRDVATAVVPHLATGTTGIFNLAATNITMLELAETVQTLVPSATITTTDMPFQDLRNYQVSSDLVGRVLGFSPIWSIEDGIIEVAEAVKSRRIPDVTLPRFSNVGALRGKL